MSFAVVDTLTFRKDLQRVASWSPEGFEDVLAALEGAK
jgi:hypothetical protein